MSQNFKLDYNQILGLSEPIIQNNDMGIPDQIMKTPDHYRNLGIKWPDGKLFFINYAYLVSAEYDP